MCMFVFIITYITLILYLNVYILLKITLWLLIVFKVKSHFGMFYAVILDIFSLSSFSSTVLFQKHK